MSVGENSRKGERECSLVLSVEEDSDLSITNSVRLDVYQRPIAPAVFRFGGREETIPELDDV